MKLYNRQVVLLKSIYHLEKKGIKSMIAIVKIPFLLKNELSIDQEIPFYSFFPYKYGPFSEKLYGDLRKLKREGLIDESETSITDKGKGYLKSSNSDFDEQILSIVNRFKSKNEILNYVYVRYPEYTVRSTLTRKSSNSITKKKEGKLFTIGYEKTDIDEFLRILIKNEIDVLIDVRKNPFSMNFAFTKSRFKEHLNRVEIKYKHIPELGINSEDRKNLETKSDYQKLFKKYKIDLERKSELLNQIIQEGKNQRVVLLCFEKDKDFCHRGVLGEYLANQNCKVEHL